MPLPARSKRAEPRENGWAAKRDPAGRADRGADLGGGEAAMVDLLLVAEGERVVAPAAA